MTEHQIYMARALGLAERARGRVSPNPLVGAVVVLDGVVVGEGWHQGPGTPHAEVMALASAGERARGATLYCTLEPCDHVGRTPACTGAVIQSGVSLVVAAAGDPNPVVDGRGFARLRTAGIDVTVGLLELESRRLNEAYERHVVTGLPFVTLKMAASLDGRTAARDGSSKWITGEAARADVQTLRSIADAIVVGAGTAIADDPSLTARDPNYSGPPPLRVVVDATGRVPTGLRLFDHEAETLVATTDDVDDEQVHAWAAAGADVEIVERDPSGRVSLPDLLSRLGKRDVQGVLVEGGGSLAWGFVQAGCVDRLVLYVAPKLIGGADAPGMLMGDGVASIADALDVDIVSVERVGEDLKVVADVHRDR